MITLTIRLDATLEKTLDRVATSSGRTKSEIAREAPRRQLAVVRSTELTDFITSEAIQIVGKAEPAILNAGATDALVLDEALAGHADIVVTGDAALLPLVAIGAPTALIMPARRHAACCLGAATKGQRGSAARPAWRTAPR